MWLFWWLDGNPIISENESKTAGFIGDIPVVW